MIQEYQKASIEALGLKLIKEIYWDDGSATFEVSDNINNSVYFWQPDTDLNQMGIILKHVLKSGWQVYMFAEENGEYWVRFKCVDKETIQHFSDTLEKAFMKAFMEWQRKEEG